MAEDARESSSTRVKQADAGSTGSDEVLEISTSKPKKQKKTKAQRRLEATAREAASGGEKRRRVIFKPERNETREFHKHSKVATRSLEVSSAPKSILKSAIKKPREEKQAKKMTKKVAKFAK